MDPNIRENVARYIAHVQPINVAWTEQRWFFRMGGNIYPITDNIEGIAPGWNPKDHNSVGRVNGGGWTIGNVFEFLKVLGIEPFLMEVKVFPNE